jgi:hypothetical protein
MIKVEFGFLLPSRNFKVKKQDSHYEGAYRYRWAVFDEDYEEMSSSELLEELKFQSKNKWRNNKVSGRIQVTLPPGSYVIALRVEDIYSNTLGIYRKTFSNRRHSHEMVKSCTAAGGFDVCSHAIQLLYGGHGSEKDRTPCRDR